jgi:hypothetical protein
VVKRSLGRRSAHGGTASAIVFSVPMFIIIRVSRGRDRWSQLRLTPLGLTSSTLRASHTVRECGATGRTKASASEKAGRRRTRNDVSWPSEMEAAGHMEGRRNPYGVKFTLSLGGARLSCEVGGGGC